MNNIISPWSGAFIKAHPIRFSGIVLHLLLRLLYGIFWLFAGINKFRKDWLTTDILEQTFIHRLTELPPDSFAVFYLTKFAIPLYPLIAAVVAIGEIYCGIALLLGATTKLASGLGFFILLNFAIGGYYDASLLIFFALSILFMCYPSGHWLGLDKRLSLKYPNSILYR